MTPEQAVQLNEACKFINAHPACASLLYDMNLLPEQVTESEHRLHWMFNVVRHMQLLIVVEREACAKLCEAMECHTYDQGTSERFAWNKATMDCGETIRMRANVE